MKIALLDIEPPIWRRFEMRSDNTLAELRLAVQIIMGWEDSHLDSFSICDETYSVPRPMMGEDFEDAGDLDAREVSLGDVLPKPGRPFGYTYDFGDSWEHELVVEKVLPIAPDATYPRCLEGARACPPEDCGGPGGYADMLEALADPSHEQHEEMKEWVGEGFDAEAFNLSAVNKELLRYFKPRRRKQ